MISRELAENLKPEVIESFKRAIEIGKWPDGQALTDEQKEICMQTVIAYEYLHCPEEERTGYVPPKNDPCSMPEREVKHEDRPLKWQDEENKS